MYTCSIFNEMQKYSTTLDIFHKCIERVIRNIPKFHEYCYQDLAIMVILVKFETSLTMYIKIARRSV